MKGLTAVFAGTVLTAILAVTNAVRGSTQEPVLQQETTQQQAINMVGLVVAQHDSIDKNADSIRLETCRGGTLNANGTCSGRKYTPRTTRLYTWSMRIKHHKYRADSIMNQFVIKAVPPVSSNPGSPGNVGYVASTEYNSDSIYLARPGVDSVTVCGVVTDAQGVRKLAWPALRLGQGHADSTGWGIRGGNPMSVMCAAAIERNQITQLDSIPVTWSGTWVNAWGRRLFRPFFSLP